MVLFGDVPEFTGVYSNERIAISDDGSGGKKGGK